MRIYDISQEVFSCAVYPGDPKPEKQTLYSTGAGDLYNLTAHNGTHVDVPFHFLHNGKMVDQMDLAHLYVSNEDTFHFFKADHIADLPGYAYIRSVTL